MKLAFIFVIVIMAIVSCKTKNMIQGIYRPDKETGPDRSTLTIKQDYSFSFTNFSDILGTKTTNGRWHVKKNLLYLEKDSLPIVESFIKIIEKTGKTDSKTIVRVIDAADNKPIIGANIQINDEQTRYTVDTTGVVNIDSTIFLKSILFSYASIQKKQNIINRNVKDVTLIVNFNNLPVVGELIIPNIWVIRKNKLIPSIDNAFFKSSDNVYRKKSEAN